MHKISQGVKPHNLWRNFGILKILGLKSVLANPTINGWTLSRIFMIQTALNHVDYKILDL